MLKKYKIIALVAIVLVYGFGIVCTFSGDLIANIQLLRYENQIKNNKNSTLLEFTKQQWLDFSDHKEIKHNSTYYDVLSVKITDTKVVAKVVSDQLESKFRLDFLKVFTKNKPTKSENENSKFDFFSKHISIPNYKGFFTTTHFLMTVKGNFSVFFQDKTRSYINLLQKPPRYN